MDETLEVTNRIMIANFEPLYNGKRILMYYLAIIEMIIHLTTCLSILQVEKLRSS